jgi:hypothetical protein
MEITFNAQPLVTFFAQPGYLIAWKLFIYGGWVPTLILGFFAWFLYRKHSKQIEFVKNTEHVCLAIDVPRENVQSLRAAEQLFTALWGILSPGNKVEQHWEGKVQLGYSFEIVSLEGVIQFFVRTPVKYRDIVEGAIYGQFPDVEITEVQDYMAAIPADAWKLESDYKVWGTQARYSKHNAYPIRTYPAFDNEIAVDERLVDPIAGLLEAFSRLGPGELLAMQYLIRPVGDTWAHSAVKVMKKMIGEKAPVKDHVGDKLVSSAMKGIVGLGNVVSPSGPAKSPEKKDQKNILGQLTPGAINVLKAIENKMGKTCFQVKVRQLYVARKDAFVKAHGVMAVWGAMRGLGAPDLNALRPGKVTTEVNYWRVDQRVTKIRKKILDAFRERSYFKGTGWLVMSVEELATLWHFPLITVKTPMLRRAGARRAEAPSGLVAAVAPQGTNLGALPAVEEPAAEVPLDLDDKTFEHRLEPGLAVPPLGVEPEGRQLSQAPVDQFADDNTPPNLPIV